MVITNIYLVSSIFFFVILSMRKIGFFRNHVTIQKDIFKRLSFFNVLTNRTDRSNTYSILRVMLSVRHDTRHYANSRRAPIWGLRHEGLRLVEDGAPSSKGAVVRATSRAREWETHHYTASIALFWQLASHSK